MKAVLWTNCSCALIRATTTIMKKHKPGFSNHSRRIGLATCPLTQSVICSNSQHPLFSRAAVNGEESTSKLPRQELKRTLRTYSGRLVQLYLDLIESFVGRIVGSASPRFLPARDGDPQPRKLAFTMDRGILGSSPDNCRERG